MDEPKPSQWKKKIAFAIQSTIAVALYPIAMWSPPWSENAYYTHNHGDWDTESHHYSRFRNGTYYECGFSRPSEHEDFVAYTVKKSLHKESNGLWWNTKVNKDGSISKYSISFSMTSFTTGGKRINTGSVDIGIKGTVYDKIFNPITLYYIRWLEWQNK